MDERAVANAGTRLSLLRGLIGLPSGTGWKFGLFDASCRYFRCAWLSALYSSVCGRSEPAGEIALLHRVHESLFRVAGGTRDRIDREDLRRIGIAMGERFSVPQGCVGQRRAILAVA